jgi:EAL domain-containing protein (putative c-di-GMP-specific phosphodiesterase class I)
MPDTPDLRSLIEKSTAFFQPIVDLNTGQVFGDETLVRFVYPDGTLRVEFWGILNSRRE